MNTCGNTTDSEHFHVVAALQSPMQARHRLDITGWMVRARRYRKLDYRHGESQREATTIEQ